MGKTVRVITISGNGTNCEIETSFAFRFAGATISDIVHISEIIHGEVSLDDYHILALAGGFLDGDDLGAAKAMANRLRFAKILKTGEPLIDAIGRFYHDGKLIIGICNGFQLMVKTGLLPGIGGGFGKQVATITYNDSGRFEDRWTYLKTNENSPSIFTKGIEKLYLPVRHGEGKFVAGADVLAEMESNNLIVLRYAADDHTPTMSYPENPNGSFSSIAGITDKTGRLFALMPHPEGHIFKTQHPRWTREDDPHEGIAINIFKNAVDYVKKSIL